MLVLRVVVLVVRETRLLLLVVVAPSSSTDSVVVSHASADAPVDAAVARGHEVGNAGAEAAVVRVVAWTGEISI